MRFIGVVVAETEKALLFQDWFWHAPDWMPKSQCTLYADCMGETSEVQIEASAWICRQKQISEFQELCNNQETDDAR